MMVSEKLENILIRLKEIDEENFDENFPKVVNDMISARDEIFNLEKSGFFAKNPDVQKKVENATKLISEEYDNKISLWKSKLNKISEMLVSSKNEKKILSYKR